MKFTRQGISWLVGVFLAVLILAAGALYWVHYAGVSGTTQAICSTPGCNQTSTSNIATSSMQTSQREGTCETQYTPSVPPSTPGQFPAFVFATNMTADVCVNISVPSSSYSSAAWNETAPVSVLESGAWASEGSVGIAGEDLVANIQPPDIRVAPGSNGSYLFQIIPGSAQAVYSIGLPNPCWMENDAYFFVVAVGYDSAGLQSIKPQIQQADTGVNSGCSGVVIASISITGITNLDPIYET